MSTQVLGRPFDWDDYWAYNITFFGACGIGLFSSIRILRTELLKRKKMDNDQVRIKYFELFSATTIILVIINWTLYICEILPFLCAFTYIQRPSFGLPLISMGLFQLFRLYYCFSATQCHSSKGYSKQLFIFMIMYPFCVTIYWFMYPLILIDLTISKNGECIIFEPSNYNIFSPIGGIAYILWDWSILILIAYKILQFHKSAKSLSIPESVRTRVNGILKKVLLLTIFYEATVAVILILNSFVLRNWKTTLWQFIIFFILLVIERTMLCYIQLLMLEHNQNEYVKFVKILNRVKIQYLCCCCKYLIAINDENEQELAQVNKEYVEHTIYNTKSISETKNVGIANYEPQSEETKTHIEL
eukprot:122485_1